MFSASNLGMTSFIHQLAHKIQYHALYGNIFWGSANNVNAHNCPGAVSFKPVLINVTMRYAPLGCILLFKFELRNLFWKEQNAL